MAYLVRMVGSQKPIAKAMNVTPQTFSAWLARRTSAASFKAVANSSRELLKEVIIILAVALMFIEYSRGTLRKITSSE